MFIKLYKKINNSIHYWELWTKNNKNLTIHWGELGKKGRSKNIRAKIGQDINKITKIEKEKSEKKGFKLINLDDHFGLILQFKTNNKKPSKKDLEKKYNIENLINESLGWTGNGHCDGGDAGSGTINIFSFVVDYDIATKTIINTLKRNKIIEDFIIAKQKNDEIIVIYPKNYSNKFQFYGNIKGKRQSKHNKKSKRELILKNIIKTLFE